MFTIHQLFKSQVVPSVYKLITEKKIGNYEQFFKRITGKKLFRTDCDKFNQISIFACFIQRQERDKVRSQ